MANKNNTNDTNKATVLTRVICFALAALMVLALAVVILEGVL